MVRIKKVPDVESALALVSRISEATKPLDVDLSEIDFVPPGPALLLSSTLRRTEMRPIINDTAGGFSYAAHIGFFDACGIPNVGKRMGEASGSRGYSPIRYLEIEGINRDARKQGNTVPEFLQIKGENLARLLTQGANPQVLRVVRYAMREILRNCVEHSKSTALWYSGQYWDSQHMVEVAVLDEGVGMLATLNRNAGELVGITDEELAIRMALLPAVSGVPEKQRKGYWANSGFGLYVTRKICTRGAGSFGVVSNSAAIILGENGENKLKSAFQGTLIQMRLDTSKLDQLNGAFAEDIAREGEAEAEARTGKKSPASSGSRSVVVNVSRK